MSGQPKLRGFAAMSEEQRVRIARKGGASTPAEARAFAKDRDLASEAGRRGGLASVAARRAMKAARAT